MWCLSHWLEWWKHSLCWSVCSVQEMEDEFLSASFRGYLPAVEQLLANGCPVKAKNKVKYTHLSVYIQTCQAACFHSVEHSHSNVTSLPPPTHTLHSGSVECGLCLVASLCKVNRTVYCHSSHMQSCMSTPVPLRCFMFSPFLFVGRTQCLALCCSGWPGRNDPIPGPQNGIPAP